jgi:hypothetical protein
MGDTVARHNLTMVYCCSMEIILIGLLVLSNIVCIDMMISEIKEGDSIVLKIIVTLATALNFYLLVWVLIDANI